MELDERLLGSDINLGEVDGNGACRSRTLNLSLGRDSLLLLVSLSLESVISLDSFNESLAGVGDSDVLDSDVQELVEILASNLL